MRRYPLYLFDLDGTLYRGSEPTPYGPETVAKLRADGAKIRFLTNNSGKTRGELSDKLASLGYEASPSEVYGTSFGAAMVCNQNGWTSAFVVGEPSLAETLAQAGIAIVNDSMFSAPPLDPASAFDQIADVAVVGICRSYTYRWMDAALQQIRAGAVFMATNRDATYPLEGGRVEPGAGTIVASIEVCSGVEPLLVGKPTPFLVHLALEEAGVSPNDALVVGDRLDTDLAAGLAAGCDAWLVLTGITQTPPQGQAAGVDLRTLL